MPKPRYLVKDNKGWKLRRVIPPQLQPFAQRDPDRADKTSHKAFVERSRLAGKNQADRYQEARLFGVETDLFLNKWQKLHDEQGAASPPDAPRCKFSLSETEARQLALIYFRKADKANLTACDGDGLIKLSEEDREWNVIQDLSEAVQNYRGNNTENPSDPHFSAKAQAIKLLCKYGFANEDDFYEQRDISRKGSDKERVVRLLIIPTELEENTNFRLLYRRIEEADIELAQRELDRLKFGSSDKAHNKFFEAASATDLKIENTNKAKRTLKQLTDAFIESKSDVTKSRLDQYKIPIRLMHEEFGEHLPLAEITVHQCDELVKLLQKIPSNYTKTYPGASIREAINLHEKKIGGFSDRRKAAQNSLQILRAIFSLAKRKRWLEINPFEDQKIEISHKGEKKYKQAKGGYQPFTDEELSVIFHQPLFTGSEDDEYRFFKPAKKLWRRSRYWSLILAVWTGCRMNEILQLERGDIKQEGKIWYISVTDEEEIEYDPETFEKRLKNANAVRNIPIHPKLIEYGFVDWVKNKKPGRLFPEAVGKKDQKPSLLFSKKTATFLKKAGVWQAHKKVFHSLRNNFNDALRNGGVEPEIRELINGWQRQHEMDANYGVGHSLDKMYQAILKLECTAFDFPHLRPEVWSEDLDEQ